MTVQRWNEFPRGWYALAASDELAPGAVRSGRWFGREQVLWRGQSGQLTLNDAHCPHLGAHLGVGGTVEGDALRCPFHHFTFDGQGQCVATPYEGAAPRAQLRCAPVREQDGLVLAWHDSAGGEPDFTPPHLDDAADWSRLRTHRFSLRTHPQETAENSVDTGHLTAVHGYRNVHCLEPLRIEGPTLRVRYGMERSATSLGLPGRWVKVEFDIFIDGLGVSRVEASTPALGMRTRHWVLPVPMGEQRCELMIGVQVHRGSTLGVRALAELAGCVLIRAFIGDVSQDLDIWENKVHVHPPRLAAGDGPIGRYRAWASQFHG